VILIIKKQIKKKIEKEDKNCLFDRRISFLQDFTFLMKRKLVKYLIDREFDSLNFGLE